MSATHPEAQRGTSRGERPDEGGDSSYESASRPATAHDANAHAANAHDANAHDANAHDANAHDANEHDATEHDATEHDANAHAAVRTAPANRAAQRAPSSDLPRRRDASDPPGPAGPRPRTPPPAAHHALVAKIDAFGRAVAARRGPDLACRAGCTACCQDGLTVSDVEASLVREGLDALDHEARARLARRLDAGARLACVLLDDDGRCSIYAARPLVCRTQGLPLRYPDGTIPTDAILARGRADGGEITWCPLNFTARAPDAADVLDAGRVDVMLALSNREAGLDPLRRTPLDALAREALDADGHAP